MEHALFFTRFSANYERRREISQIFDSCVSPRSCGSFNNRTYPPIVYAEESYKRNCCANSKVTKSFVFLWPFINYKKTREKIIKSFSTTKKYSFNNRTTPRCHSSNFLKNNRLVKTSQASYLPLHFANFHFHISQR